MMKATPRMGSSQSGPALAASRKPESTEGRIHGGTRPGASACSGSLPASAAVPASRWASCSVQAAAVPSSSTARLPRATLMAQSVPVQAAASTPASVRHWLNCAETSARDSSSVTSRPPASATEGRCRCTTLSSSSACSSIQERTSVGSATADTRKQALRLAVQTDMTPALDMDTRSWGCAAPCSVASSCSETGAENCELASVEASARCDAQLGKNSVEALGSRRSVGTLLAMDSRTATRGVEMLRGTPRA
mmetsp:Transcript_93309/g.290950  ORF Transcript_93309/g.290950 Transcript_93309/m.290950 type:complete len:251 (-) Transcript_93309:111-863(-)